MDQIQISYLTISYNSKGYLTTCLDSVLADAPREFEVIVVDNASSDGSASHVKENYPNVCLIQNESNVGHCAAVIQGVERARGRMIMHLDADTKVQPGTTHTMLRFFDQHPQAHVAAPRMLNADGSYQETARNFPTLINALFGRQTLLSRWFPNNPITRSYLDRDNLGRQEAFEVGWVSAACMMFPKKVWETVGPWDEHISGYWVDCDWCKTIQERGGSVYCLPQAKVWHFEQNQTNIKRSPHRIRLFNQGALRYYLKHHTKGWWDPRTPMAYVFVQLRTLLQLVQNYFLVDV